MTERKYRDELSKLTFEQAINQQRAFVGAFVGEELARLERSAHRSARGDGRSRAVADRHRRAVEPTAGASGALVRDARQAEPGAYVHATAGAGRDWVFAEPVPGGPVVVDDGLAWMRP